MRRKLFFILMTLSIPLMGWSSVGSEFEKDDFYFEITNETECRLIECGSNATNISIPDQVTYEDMTYSVTSIGNNAFSWCKNMTSVTIPSSITIIEEEAFVGSNIVSVVFQEDSRLETISDYAFSDCSKLTDISLPNSLTTIGECAFELCGLRNITIPKNVQSIGWGAFNTCENLKQVYFEEGTRLRELKGTFTCCDLTSVTLPEGITSIEDIFVSCQNLETVILPNSLLDIGDYSFMDCEKLRTIILPKVTSIGIAAFKNCTGIENITLQNVTYIGQSAFSNCTNLENISLPESLTAFGYEAFSGCSKLTSITIPENVKAIGDRVFSKCVSLEKLHISKGLEDIDGDAFAGCNLSIITVDAENESLNSPEGSNAVLDSEGSLVLGCKTTVIPSGTKYISTFAFYACEGLTSINIPEGVLWISNYAFGFCSNLESISLPNSLTSISRFSFSGCTSLQSINIPQNVRTIDTFAFEGCTGLTTITVDESNTIYDSRNNCNAIIEKSTNKLINGCNGTIIPEGITSIATGAFYGSNIASVNIPKSVTEIEHNPFRSCANLENITVDSENTVYDSRDNCNAIIETATNSLLSGCKNTIIPETVTTIKEQALWECGGFETLIIPENVRTIESGAIHRCYDLEKVILNSSTPPTISSNNFNNNSFYGDYNLKIPTFYVPAGSKSTYETADGWSLFKNYIVEKEPVAQSFSINVVEGTNWATFYQEEYDYSVSEGIKVYVVSDVDKESGKVRLQEINGIPKNTPVLLHSINNDGFGPEDKMTTIFTDIDIDGIEISNNFKGVTEATNISGLGDVYVLLGSQFVRADLASGANTILPANRCYISVAGSNGARILNLVTTDDATAIETKVETNVEKGSKWYNLQGQLISRPTESGLFIRNGKKIFVR